MFWIFLFLTLLAAAFVLWPLLRARHAKQNDDPSQASVLKAMYRARLTELNAETDDNVLMLELQDELGAVFLHEPSLQAAEQAASHGSPLGLVGIGLLVIGMGWVFYWGTADPGLLDLRGAEQVLVAEDPAELRAWQQKLRARVQAKPADDLSWYLLGRTHLALDEFEAANQAFSTAHALVGDELNILLYWLQARYLKSRGYLDDFSNDLAQKLLAEHPDFPIVLEMMALDAFRREEFATSITLLNRALNSTSNPNQQQVFATAIAQVRENLTAHGQAAPPGVTVRVSAMSKVPPRATIFVIARPVGGGMPYAVAKRAAISVPFEVRLDDLVAMSAARGLSEAEQFEVLVRLSESANVVAETSDWQWRSAPLSLALPNLPIIHARLAPP